MAGSFLDTTIVVNVSDSESPDREKSEHCIEANQPSETPYYALRELLAGHVQNLCDAHNGIHAAETPAEAMLYLANRFFYSGRKKDSMLQAVFQTLDAVYKQDPAGSRNQMKPEALEYLALRINGLWRKAHKPKHVDLVQTLACFNDGKLEYGPAGELRAPNNSFNCHKDQRCAAAAYLYDRKDDLKKMIDALHPNNLDPLVANKAENKSRRKALKELYTQGPQRFSKGRCRALGDAYFAAMCPPGKVVVTSNIADHLPLCLALMKQAIVPT